MKTAPDLALAQALEDYPVYTTKQVQVTEHLVSWLQTCRGGGDCYEDIPCAVRRDEIHHDARHPHWLMVGCPHPIANWGGAIQTVTVDGRDWVQYSFGADNYWPGKPAGRVQNIQMRMMGLILNRYQQREDGKWVIRG